MILLTGATGFVGTHLLDVLADSSVRVALRRPSNSIPKFAEQVVVGEWTPDVDWSTALRGVTAVVHLAARVHVMNSRPTDAKLFYEVNVAGTARLAESAAALGVRRFVYLSSVKVNGEATFGSPYTATDLPAPLDDYGQSKWEAEQRLREVSSGSNMELVIIRPPLVYGSGVRANFLRLLSWIYRGVPLPFGKIDNRRSMVNVWNLCDLIRLAVYRDTPTAGIFMVSDNDDLSTPDLIRRLARAMHRVDRLAPVPIAVLRFLGLVTGRTAEVSRLCGSLAVDIDATKRQLGWTPPVSVDEGLSRTAEWYLREVNTRRV